MTEHGTEFVNTTAFCKESYQTKKSNGPANNETLPCQVKMLAYKINPLCMIEEKFKSVIFPFFFNLVTVLVISKLKKHNRNRTEPL